MFFIFIKKFLIDILSIQKLLYAKLFAYMMNAKHRALYSYILNKLFDIYYYHK